MLMAQIVLLFLCWMHILLAMGPLVFMARAASLFVVEIPMISWGVLKLQLLLGRVLSRCPVPTFVSVAWTAS